MHNSSHYVVLIGKLSNQLDDASAQGFKDNPRGMNIIAELKGTIESLEEVAFREFTAKPIEHSPAYKGPICL